MVGAVFLWVIDVFRSGVLVLGRNGFVGVWCERDVSCSGMLLNGWIKWDVREMELLAGCTGDCAMIDPTT